jgi:hypothetical protein
MQKLDFKTWLEMMGSTGAIYDPSEKPEEDWNWQGAPGKTAVSPKEDPIKHWVKKRKKRGTRSA